MDAVVTTTVTPDEGNDKPLAALEENQQDMNTVHHLNKVKKDFQVISLS